MKWVKLLLGFLMATAMVVQLNDPDPWAWIALYGLTGVACAYAAFQPIKRWLLLAGIAIILIWISLLSPAFTNWLREGMPAIGDEMKRTHPYIEQVREFFGLLLCGSILIFLYFNASTQSSQTLDIHYG